MSDANESDQILDFADRQALREISRSPTEPWKRIRRAAMLLALDAGYEVNVVAGIYQMDEKSVYNLRVRYENEGLAALDDRPRAPRSRRLNETQLAQLKEHLIANPPTKTAHVVEYVKQTFGVAYSPRGMAKLLGALGFRFC